MPITGHRENFNLSISMQATVILDRNGRDRRRNAYLLKIEARSFGDGFQDICKDTESNLGPFGDF